MREEKVVKDGERREEEKEGWRYVLGCSLDVGVVVLWPGRERRERKSIRSRTRRTNERIEALFGSPAVDAERGEEY